MSGEPDLSAAERFVKGYLSRPGADLTKSGKAFPFRSRYEHTLRVREWCRRISDREPELGADRGLLMLAATLHDVGYAVDRAKHAAVSAGICRDELPPHGYPPELCARAAEIVALHSAKSLPAEGLAPELRILQDADSLDELGAMRVAWVIMEYRADEGDNATFDGCRAAVAKDAAMLRGKMYAAKTRTGAELYESLLREQEAFAASPAWGM